MARSEASEDSVVVLPIDDSLSDGRRDTWPKGDTKHKYRAVDDFRWRQGLAEMWIEEIGAKEQGKFVLDLGSIISWLSGSLCLLLVLSVISSTFGGV